MKPEDVILLILLAGCGTLVGIAAKRQAAKLGLPPGAVPVLGAIVLELVDGTMRRG